MKKELKDLQGLNMQELKDRADALRQELFSLRLQIRTSYVKDNSQFKKLRKDIARVLTVKTQKEAQEVNSGN
ncbi:50S ribosomal protein L29 [candidate division TM6 bacterium RIFCSPHIGHO2_12_FULL_36_22]|nr:MAG: 50S ribosomal protein L29 [candidate division TM6 bacterium RIFCSPHIGHO2_12_FULL_36_22]